MRVGSIRSTAALAAAPLAAVALALAAAALLPPDARATLAPSPDLSFRAILSPDSITVGDPIAVVLESSAPVGAVLQLPQLADSIGPFTVLSAAPPTTSTQDGRVRVRQEGTVTLFKTGTSTFPELALLWVRAPAETLVAYSKPQDVRVGSLLKGEASLQKLHGVKGVVSLQPPRWWLWVLLGAVALLAAWFAPRLWRRLRRRAAPEAAPEAPPLPPEVVFERGLLELYRQELPERGQVKEFYARLSLLFREYLEGRFRFPAVEETRTEVLAAASRLREMTAEERNQLSDWLTEGDLVKFAKMERLLDEAKRYAERAREWVRHTAPTRVVDPAPAPEGAAAAGGTPAAPAFTVPAAGGAAEAGTTAVAEAPAQGDRP